MPHPPPPIPTRTQLYPLQFVSTLVRTHNTSRNLQPIISPVANMLRTSIVRAATGSVVRNQVRCASTHAISNPTLADIEKRWEGMPPQEQAELWMSLRDRMKINWAELTLQEKKAAYYIAFGAHGPRAQTPPGEGWKVFGYTMGGVGVSLALFLTIRSFAKGSPSTMNKEWEEATNEYLRSQNSEPISGLSSEGYSGPGQVQSAPKKN